MLQLKEHRKERRGLGREVEADCRLDGFRLSSGLQMQIENQICTRIQAPAHTVRFRFEHRTRFPEQEMGIGIERIRAALSRDVHTWETGLAIFAIALA